MNRYVDIEFILNETDEFGYENGVLHSISGNSAPTIKTKQIKYFDEGAKVWKIGSVIVDE